VCGVDFSGVRVTSPKALASRTKARILGATRLKDNRTPAPSIIIICYFVVAIKREKAEDSCPFYCGSLGPVKLLALEANAFTRPR
jgi:hypothetical protein